MKSMEYIEIFKEMLGSLRADVKKYISGNKEEYLYKKQHTEKWGDTDCNYTNRQRLLYGLLYKVCDVAKPDRERIIRELLETEIVSRENESFQGIGENLEMLTYLMYPYRRKEDEKLFERAKNANFDCFCGYMHDALDAYNSYYEKPIDSYSLERCIDISGELGLKEFCCRFVDIYKDQVTDIADYRSLKRYSEYTGRREDFTFAVEGRFKKALLEKRDSFEMVCAYDDYIELLLEEGKNNEAYLRFNECREYYSEYGRSAWQIGIKLMQLMPDNAEEIWRFILPHLKTDIKNNMIALDYCNDVIKCAEAMGDKAVASAVKRHYDKTMAEINQHKITFSS